MEKRMKFQGVLGMAALMSWMGCAPGLPLNSGTTSVSSGPGSSFLAENICSGVTIYGLTGTATCADAGGSCSTPGTSTVVSLNTLLQSNAYRDLATTQISQSAEVTTYAGVALPAGYRSIPDLTKEMMD